MTSTDFLDRLQGVAKTREGWQARCPAHEDRRASLSVANGQTGLVIHCHAGCTPEAITGAIGLKLADLFNGNGNHGHDAEPKKLVAVYDYQDAGGGLLFQVVRYEPKQFRQRHPDGKGGWVWNMKGIERVLYRLPEINRDIARDLPIFIVEGEKDVAALVQAGFCATCNSGGAGKWQDNYTESLRGADVVIIGDKDEPGRAHAKLVGSKLAGVARRVRILELPDLNGRPVKDPHDFFAAGGQAVELDELAEWAPDWDPAREETVEALKDGGWTALVEDGAELQTRELPPIVEIVGGILPEQSKLSIVSSAKCFKTWLTIYLGLAISHGLEFLGRPTTRSRVLYVNLELKPKTFTRRLQAIALALNCKIDSNWFGHLSLRGKLSGICLVEIVTRIIAVARARSAQVVVIDPLFKLNIEGEENSSRDQTIFCNELDRLTTEGFTAVFNDHSTKGNQSEKEPLDVIRGSSAKGGDLDCAMVLRKHEVVECFRVDMVHRELPPVDPFVIGWKFPLMELRPDLSPEAMKKPKGGRKPSYEPADLLSAIKETTAGNGISVSAWSKSLNISRQTLQEYLPKLRTNGWIGTAGEGNCARQYITDKGKQLLSEAA